MIKIFLQLSIVLSFIHSCSTVSSLKNWGRSGTPVVYSGVRSCWGGIPGGQGPVGGPAALFTALYCLIDTPFSFTLDTVFLPISIPFSAGKYLYYKDNIYIAVKEYNHSRIQYFIENGADLNSEDFSGRTVLDYSFEKCILHKQENAEYRKHYYSHNRRIADLLFAKGARKTSSKAGSTALHYAAYCGYADMAASLLKEGFSPNQKNREGLTPLNIAEKENEKEILALFIKADKL